MDDLYDTLDDLKRRIIALRQAMSEALATMEQRVAALEAMHEEVERVPRAS
jgi:hypothetical protein